MQQLLMHKHYTGAAHSFEIVTAKDPVAGKYVRPDVTILKTFFIDDSVNVNDWQATWEGLLQDAQELPGVPLVLQEDLQHPSFSVQEYYDRGTIFDYDIDEEKHQIIVYVRITDPKIVDRIKSGELEYVSPAVIPRSSEALRKINGVDVLGRTLPLHLAIVGDPAYGKDKAKMTHLCTGNGEACYHRLKMMTAQAQVKDIIKREHELLDKGIPEDKVHEILKKEFAADLQSCVSRKIPIIKKEHPDWKDDKVQAVSYSYCREHKAEGEGEGTDNSGIKSNLKIHNADQGITALEQMPFIRKMVASITKMQSILDQTRFGMKYPIVNGREGRWIKAKGMDVFVARNQSLKEALLDQCGCAKIGAVLDGRQGEWITIKGHHIFIPDNANPNTFIKKYFDDLEEKEQKKPDKPKSDLPARTKVLTKTKGTIDPKHLEIVDDILDTLNEEDLNGVQKILITASKTNQRKIVAGEWTAESKTLKVTTHSSFTEQDYKETIYHEIGHVDYTKIPQETKAKWAEAIKDITPPTNYARHHRDRVRNYESKWKYTRNYRDDPSQKQIIDKNITMLTNLYYEEVHSEVVSHLRTGGLKQNKLFGTGMEKAVKAYNEVFKK